MATSGDAIRHLWTHKTQDHPWLADEELVIDRAEGVWVWTERGKKLLDGFAGLAVVNVGHGRREIAEAIAEQTVRLAYYPTTRQFSNRPAAELAAKLAALTPGDLEYSFFAVSGAEANERAMQMARHYWLASGKPTKDKVVSLEGGYHGGTTGTFAVCGLPHLVAPYADLHVPGFAKITPPYPFRDRGRGTDEELVQRRARELRQAIVDEGPETVSAVIMEPVISSGGFIMPPIGWLREVRAICDELGVLMIADEVITGFGRTGRWFACEHDGIVPDLMTVAKGITSGYIPLSAAIARRRLADAFPRRCPAGERAPRHLRGAPRRRRGGARQHPDHGEGQPRGERRGDGHAPARRAPAGGPQEAHRRRGARPRPHGVRRARGARRLGPAARQGAGRPARSQGVGPGRDRLRARPGREARTAALHHPRGGRSARGHRGCEHRGAGGRAEVI